MVNILGIIQARMGSTRLPGKILKPIKGEPMLSYTVKRLGRSKLINKVVVATSTNKENDPVEVYCQKHDIECYRGDEDDVLDRFYQCAIKYDADIIVRITGDCPLIDPQLVNIVINFYIANRYDIVINTWFKNSYPSGFDVEVFNFSTLKKQWDLEKDIKRREHVMNTLSNKNFNVGKFTDLYNNFINDLNFDINILHLSVDTPEDFVLVEKIINHFDNDQFGFDDIMNYLNKNPELVETNLTKTRKEVMLKLKK